MIHVLHYITGLPPAKGGIESFVLNLYEGIDKSRFEFSLLTRHYFPDSDCYKEFCAKGIPVYSLDMHHIRGVGDILEYQRRLKDFFSLHAKEFDFFHCNYLDDPFLLKYAKRYGIPHTALHAHANMRENTSFIKEPVKNISLHGNMAHADYLFACSKRAGMACYGNKDFILVNNTINTESFRFDPNTRERMRKELNISEDTCALCYTGRFSPVKNVPFLIEVMRKLDKRFVLFLVGFGTDQECESLRKMVKEYGLENSVRFTGARNDVKDLLMDIYLQASFSEGFPFSLVEAQCSGLPCIISTGFPDEIAITPLVHRIDLAKGAQKWADMVLHLANSSLEREGYAQMVRDKGYDTRTEAAKLGSLYAGE